MISQLNNNSNNYSFQNRKHQAQVVLLVNSSQTFKEEVMPVLYNYFQKIEGIV